MNCDNHRFENGVPEFGEGFQCALTLTSEQILWFKRENLERKKDCLLIIQASGSIPPTLRSNRSRQPGEVRESPLMRRNGRETLPRLPGCKAAEDDHALRHSRTRRHGLDASRDENVADRGPPDRDPAVRRFFPARRGDRRGGLPHGERVRVGEVPAGLQL